jgi:large subunit ribosomal protein L23
VSNFFKDHRDVLIAPVVSEKSYGLLDNNKYTFIVHPDANKTARVPVSHNVKHHPCCA